MALALFVLVVVVILRPLFAPPPAHTLPTTEIDDLLLQHDSILAALRDLDFDHATDKIPAETYTIQRQQLLAEGVAVLKQLDALGVADAGNTGRSDTLEADIERVIAARVSAGRRQSTAAPLAAPAAAHFCPECETQVEPTDKFCATCGATLNPAKVV